MDFWKMVLQEIAEDKIVELVMFAVIFDTIFGVIRACKEHKFNSCFGIDGAIRKISMVISIALLMVVDHIVNVNLISFIPESARDYIGLEKIGTADFFGLLYICYEVVSILKNMYLCGLPVHKVWNTVKKFLENYTDELPDSDDEPVTNDSDGSTAAAATAAAEIEDKQGTETEETETDAEETEQAETDEEKG